MSAATNLAGATSLGWTITDSNGNAATATSATDTWRAEKVFTLEDYDIGGGASIDASRKVVHEQATTQAQLFLQIDAWETRMGAIVDDIGYTEPSFTPDAT